MTEFLRRPFPQKVQRGLRRLEAKIMPKAAKERTFYESQQLVLQNPQTREQYLQYLCEKAARLIPTEQLPGEDELVRYQPTPDMYLKPSQAFYSDHNIAHASIVMVGSLAGARYLKAIDPERYGTIREDAILAASSLHDTQRKTDELESIVCIERHGIIASQRVPSLIARMKDATLPPQSLPLVRQILRYHDVDRKQLGDTYTDELGIVVAADRAALERLFSSPHLGARVSAGEIASRRMKGFKNGGIASDPAIFGQFIELLGALDILVKQKLAQGRSPLEQFQLVMESAKEIGLVASVPIGVTQGKKAA